MLSQAVFAAFFIFLYILLFSEAGLMSQPIPLKNSNLLADLNGNFGPGTELMLFFESVSESETLHCNLFGEGLCLT